MNLHDTTLPALRRELDAIDDQLIQHLAARFAITKRVGELKAKHNLPPTDRKREAEQFARISKVALANGLKQEFAKSFLRLVINEVVRNHEALRKDKAHG